MASQYLDPEGKQAGDASVLARDWTVTAHDLYYATGEGMLLLREVTLVVPGASACALVGPNVADKGALLRLLSGCARGGYLAGRITYGGQGYHDAHLLTVFVESPSVPEWESSFFGGGGGVSETLSANECVKLSTALRFGSSSVGRYAERIGAILDVLGLNEVSDPPPARPLPPRAKAVLTRIGCAMVRSPPIVCVEDPFRGLEPRSCLAVAKALNDCCARGYTIIASLDAAATPEAAFELAFSRVVAVSDGRIAYCGELKHAATHCALVVKDAGGFSIDVMPPDTEKAEKDTSTKKKKSASSREQRRQAAQAGAACRLDAIERCLSDPSLARNCRDTYLRSSAARRVEQEASHVEPIDEERSSVHWLAPPYVSSMTKLNVLLSRQFKRSCAKRFIPVTDTHLGAMGVALVWGVAFWDAGRAGRDSLALYDLTALAFACGLIIVTAQLAAAPELCRRHAEFERERRSRDCGGFEFLVARTFANALDAVVLGISPVLLYIAAGMPIHVRVIIFVYSLASALAFSTACLVEALCAWFHAPPPPDAFGGGGGDFETERRSAARAERLVTGVFGTVVSCMFLSTGFGVELRQFVRANPFFWHARINHLRWFVQGLVLRVHSEPDFHPGQADLQNTGWATYRPMDSIPALLVLAAFARVISLYFLQLDPPKLRQVDAKKLSAWAIAPAHSNDDDNDPAAIKSLAAATGEEGAQGKSESKGESQMQAERRSLVSEDEAKGAFALAVEAYPVSIMAQGVSLAWRRSGRTRPVVLEASLEVSAREALLVSGDDPDAPRCLLRSLAGRSLRRSRGDTIGSAGRVVVNGSARPRDWRSKCAWFAASNDGRLDQLAVLPVTTAVKFVAMLAFAGSYSSSASNTSSTDSEDPSTENNSYRARGFDGTLSAPPSELLDWWVQIALCVAGITEPELLQASPDSMQVSDLSNLQRRRVALACELVRAPVAVWCDDLGGGARESSCGSREALAPREAAQLARSIAGLAPLGCAVVATAHGPCKSTLLAFDRCAIMVARGPDAGSFLAVDMPPSLLLADVVKLSAVAPGARDLEIRPVAVAVTALRLQRQSGISAEGGSDDYADAEKALDFEAPARGDPMCSGAVVASFSVGSWFSQYRVQVRREFAAMSADREALGAAIGAPFATALLVGAAMWNQGRQDARTVVWIAYLLFSALGVPLSLPRIAASARTLSHEADAGLAAALPYFFAQITAYIPLLLLRSALTVVIVFLAASLEMRPLHIVTAMLSCMAISLTMTCIGMAAIYAYLARAAPNCFVLDGPSAARRRALVVARAGDLCALILLVALVFAGVFRFVADFDRPWRDAADADFARWLVQAMATPQLRGQTPPSRFPKSAERDTALQFLGYNSFQALAALSRGALYGPAPAAIIALLALARMRAVDQE